MSSSPSLPPNSPSSFAAYFGLYVSAFLIAATGWTGLYFLITTQIPTIGPRWFFFLCWVMALTGTSVPFVHFLHRRFNSRIAPTTVILREALWVGMFGAVIAWLQLGRSLNIASALLVLGGLIAIETFLILRERSHWNPYEKPLPDDKPPQN